MPEDRLRALHVTVPVGTDELRVVGPDRVEVRLEVGDGVPTERDETEPLALVVDTVTSEVTGDTFGAAEEGIETVEECVKHPFSKIEKGRLYWWAILGSNQ